MSKLKKMYFGLTTAMAFMLYSAITVFAAADADISAAANTLSSDVKDNVIGVISDNLTNIALGGIFILVIYLVWRLIKRFTK